MSTLRDQVIAAMQTALLNHTDAGANVFRTRKDAIDRDQVPAIVLRPMSEPSQRFSSAVDKNEFDVLVIIMVRADAWDQVADGIAAAAHRLIMTNTALNALALDIRKTATEYEDSEADMTAGELTATYRITYLSRFDDIGAQP